MGTVYEALDPFINRKVALKTMIAGLADNPELKARFLREAQSAGGLRHRNIVTVYDLGEDKGQPFIAMEFIEGTDLEKVIQNREPRTVEWKLDVLRQLCEGLGAPTRPGSCTRHQARQRARHPIARSRSWTSGSPPCVLDHDQERASARARALHGA
jgi:serine/threonine protein kinase